MTVLEEVLHKSGNCRYSSESLLRQILVNEGVEDDEVIAETPRRWLSALREQLEPKEFSFTTFPSDSNEMVIVQDIQFSSMCAHHLLPFFGLAHVAYIPQGQIVGLSKIPRAVRFWAHGLWTQEELTTSIADNLDDQLSPIGVAVVMAAEHTCMSARGVRAPGAKTTTSAMRGAFADHSRLARSEFLGLIK